MRLGWVFSKVHYFMRLNGNRFGDRLHVSSGQRRLHFRRCYHHRVEPSARNFRSRDQEEVRFYRDRRNVDQHF